MDFSMSFIKMKIQLPLHQKIFLRDEEIDSFSVNTPEINHLTEIQSSFSLLSIPNPKFQQNTKMLTLYFSGPQAGYT